MPERPGRSGVSPVRSCPIANTAAQDRDESFPFSLRQLGGKEGDLEGKSVQPMDATEAFGRSEISDHLPRVGPLGWIAEAWKSDQSWGVVGASGVSSRWWVLRSKAHFAVGENFPVVRGTRERRVEPISVVHAAWESLGNEDGARPGDKLTQHISKFSAIRKRRKSTDRGPVLGLEFSISGDPSNVLMLYLTEA